MGIDPPEYVTPRSILLEGESKRGYGAWKTDLYGLGVDLGSKRIARGWKDDTISPFYVDERINNLLCWRGGETGKEIFPGDLPWTHGNVESDGP